MNTRNMRQKPILHPKSPSISRYIDELRVMKGIGVREFSVMMDLNKDSYTRRLRGEDGFTEKELIKACSVLGCDITIQNIVMGRMLVQDSDTEEFHSLQFELAPPKEKKKWKEKLKK